MKKRIKKFIVQKNLWKKPQQHSFESGGFYYYNGLRQTFRRALEFVDTPGSALDIGAGFGNEVRELLKRDFKVTATDFNKESVEYLQKLAKKQNGLTVLNQALPDFPKGKFDFIVCEMVLHFLSKKDAHLSIKKMQNSTQPGGLNVITSYIEQPKIHSHSLGYYNFLFQPSELQKLYSGWEILYYEEKGNALGFKSARLIARKKY